MGEPKLILQVPKPSRYVDAARRFTLLVQGKPSKCDLGDIGLRGPDVADDLCKPRPACRPPTSFAIDELIPAVVQSPHVDGLEQAQHLDRIDEGLKFFVVEDAPIARIGFDLPDGQDDSLKANGPSRPFG